MNMAAITQSPFIHTLSASSTLTISIDDGFTKISIKNPTTSSGNVTITGNGTAYSVGVGNGVVLQPGEDWTWVSSTYPIDGVTITTAAGTTAQITAT
jgi:hypothetical protein